MIHAHAVFAFAENTLRQALRDRVLYGVLAFGIALIFLSAVLSNLALGYPVRIVTNFSLSATTFAGAAIAILLGVGAVGKEIEQRRVYATLARPIARRDFVLGTYVGVLATTYLNVALMYLGSTLMIALYSHDGPFQYDADAYLATLGLGALRLAVIAALACTFAFLASTTVAFIAALGFTIAGHLSAELAFFLSKSESAGTVWLSKIVYWVVPDFAALDTLGHLIHGQPIGGSEVVYAALYATLYSVALLTFAAWAFARRDLP